MARCPNILLIMADQLRQDALGCYGNHDLNTPNIDRIASRGVRFNNAYTVQPLCSPARYSTLTGKFPRTLGLKTNNEHVPESIDNFVRVLHSSGYTTGCFGKMHFSPVYGQYGFDAMRLAEQNGDGWKIDDYHAYLKEHGLTDWWDLWDQQFEYRENAPDVYWETYGAKGSDIPEEHYSSTWIADQTLDFIEKQGEHEPFFAWTSFIKPHHPFDPPEPYDSMYDPNQLTLLPNKEAWQDKPLLTINERDPRVAYFDARRQTDEDRRNIMSLYYGSITHIDDQIGRVLERLESKGMLDSTIVILVSDHADYLGQFGLFLKHPNIPYDALAKIPFIVVAPGILQGTSSDALVSLVDIYPTLMDLTGLQAGSVTEGKSLWPILQGKTEAVRDYVEIESEEANAIRTKRYKYLQSRDGVVEELYDLENDPFELKNIATDPASQQILKEHRKLYEEIFSMTPGI
jgi:choline-sulfatase